MKYYFVIKKDSWQFLRIILKEIFTLFFLFFVVQRYFYFFWKSKEFRNLIFFLNLKFFSNFPRTFLNFLTFYFWNVFFILFKYAEIFPSNFLYSYFL